uniref:UPF0481 protein At3g47200-like n=1 Tax=Fragaria vesca subsp. vesca TaxID=101020 RepID=UPI0005C9F7FC|nr:PREDICTED: UPF0481 protein At3g47200-like [Fragaria vesca subsp. vesca]
MHRLRSIHISARNPFSNKLRKQQTRRSKLNPERSCFPISTMEGLARDDSIIDIAAVENGLRSSMRNGDTAALPVESSKESSMDNVDVAAVETDLRFCMDNIESGNSLLSTKCCIFVTPKLLFRNNEKAFLPTAFSFGTLHHGKPDLADTQKIKLKYARDLISRVSSWNDTILNDLVKEVASLEEEVRQSYSVPVKFSKDEFVKVLLVDGCFIIELFRKSGADIPILQDDPIHGRACMLEVVGCDIFLLENQIPWVVLDRLFSKTTLPNGKQSLIELALSSFEFLGIGALEMETSLIPTTLAQSKHILELLRNLLVGSTMPEGGELDATSWELIPSASSLIEAGVKFKKGNPSNGILDIKFSDGVLEIPTLVIHEATEALFRNLISFEQCYHWCDSRITSYAMLLDILINTPKDMDILCKNGIIQNWLNPEEATEIFNNLYNNTNVDTFYYLELCQEVNKYCRRRWPRWRATYVRNHFSSPWAIASQAFAAVIFVLALLQTVFGIKK